MNSYERVMGTVKGEPVDRVPVFAVLGAYGGKLAGTPLRTLYSDAKAYAAGQKAAQEAFGFDLILAHFDYSAISEAFGGETAWFANQAPNMKRPGASDVATALTMPLPDPKRSGRLPMFLEAVRILAKEYHGKVPLIAALPGPSAMPVMAVGLEKWMETFLFDEAAAQRMLEWTGALYVDWSNALLEAGVDILVATESFASKEVAPRSLFESRLLPHLRKTIAQVKGPTLLHHGGGSISHTLDLLPGLPGVAGALIGSKDSLAEARKAIGPEMLLAGNLDNLSLPAASAQEILEKSLECLRCAAPSGRYILSHSAADVPLDTPPENLRAMVQASKDYAEQGKAAK